MHLLSYQCLLVFHPFVLANALGLSPDSQHAIDVFKRQTASSGEHVTLSECSGSGSSYNQGAYFSVDPNSKPSDKANLTWTSGKTGDWDNSTVKANFKAAAFTAELGGDVPEGELAGTGDNGYPNNGGFRCWRRSSIALYQDEDSSCNMIYDCNHDPAPSSSNTTSTDTNDSRHKGLSGGSIAGVVIGSIVFVLSVVVSAFLIWRHFKRKANAAQAATDFGRPDASVYAYTGTGPEAQGLVSPHYGGEMSQQQHQQQAGPQELHNVHLGPQELHNQSWFVPEMATGGAAQTWEMPSPATEQFQQQQQPHQQPPPGYLEVQHK